MRSDDATVQCGSMPASEVVNGGLNGEEDCVIVAQRTSTPSKAEERDCSIRGKGKYFYYHIRSTS